MKDIEKRKRVMQRSRRLGHCICEPRKPCPCEVFLKHDVCLCAGERLEAQTGPVLLTRLVEKAGCASKIDQASLKRAVAGLPFPSDPRVLVGAAAGDDAGVYRLTDDVAIVQTVDVFSPSVDDPYAFGQVAAANSVSDIYAMGGTPLTALSIVGFPIGSVPDEALHEILRGGIDKMAEAGVSVIGGHSIKDDEIKAGFAVTGIIDPARVALRAGARPGDALVLTKPLGTGILAFAGQIGRAPPEALVAAMRSMTALNRTAAERMLEYGVHGCTDVTGFGLTGHLAEMAAGSGVDVEVVWDDIPLLPGVLECVAQGIIPGSIERNRESSGGAVTLGAGVEPSMLEVCMDAQTSGGLLIALPERKARALVARLHEDGVSDAAIIGRVRSQGTGRIFLETRGERVLPETPEAAARQAPPAARRLQADVSETEACCGGESTGKEACMADEDCCAGGKGAAEAQPASAAGAGAKDAFQVFLKQSGAPGALDAATKQAIAIALSVHARCEPCVKAHIRKARKMGFSQEEIDEAAWMGIAFGGSPVMMFYEGVRDA